MKMYTAILLVAVTVQTVVAEREMVDCIDPLIGAVTYPESGLRGDEAIHGFGKTFPGATTPFGMVQLSPDTVTGGDNGPGYSYVHNTIEGFSFTHMSGICYNGEFGNIQVMPSDLPKSAFSHKEEFASA
jgi:putative alpha-1,2-mannosidase